MEKVSDITEVSLEILAEAYPKFDWKGYRVVQAGDLREKDCRGTSVLGMCFPHLKIIEMYASPDDFNMWYYTLLHEGCHSVTWNGKIPTGRRGYYHSKRFREELDKAEFRSWLRTPVKEVN